MAYVMLALGGLMAAIGAYAAITGYNIIQVEQGWASVIAGASLFVGGIVTISLALVLRTLQSLAKALTGARGEAIIAPAAPEAPALIVPPIGPTLAAPVDEAAAPPAAEPERRPPPAAEPVREILFGAPPPGDDYKLETPSTPEHDLVPPPAPAPPLRPVRTTTKSVPADDWLDRAFAEFDQEVTEPASSRTTFEPEPPASPPAPRSSTAEAPVTATAGEAAPATGDLETGVIGRYEADGTSYVMYADGSIEAQTYSGVYRFASMAELKAFIES